MSFQCQDLDRALQDQDRGSLEALELHARECPACARELRLWREISEAAPSLGRDWESPGLWPRIEETLSRESSSRRDEARSIGRVRKVDWKIPLAAGVAFLMMSSALVWILTQSGGPAVSGLPGSGERQRLLTEKALQEIESAENDYVQAIEKLSQLVGSKTSSIRSPLMVAFGEKLALIDSAIRECRTGLESNRFNAHLQAELMAMYREKRRTLEAMLKETGNERQ